MSAGGHVELQQPLDHAAVRARRLDTDVATEICRRIDVSSLLRGDLVHQGEVPFPVVLKETIES